MSKGNNMIEIQLKGFAELEKRLMQLPENLQKRAVQQATKEGAKIIELAAKQTAPRGTQPLRPKAIRLYQAIAVGKGRLHKIARTLGQIRSKYGFITSIIALKKGARHGIPVHYGHDIVKGGSKKKGGRVVAHVEANPFMARAFNANTQRAINVIRVRLAEAIERLYKKHVGTV